MTPPAGTLAWRVHLFAERPGRGWMALGIMAVVMALLHFAGDDRFIPFAFVVFFISLAPFFFPTHYELTPDGVTRRVGLFSTRRRWEEFPRFYPDAEGVKLSTFARPSRREPFRGMWLRFAGNRDEVLAYVASKIGRPATDG
jgi:hypothetical protein